MSKEKVRWGIISTAAIAEKSFIPALLETVRGELVAVASRTRAKADSFAGKHDIPSVYDDYASLLASDEIDAVYNPLPNTMHAEWTIAAAEQGKHVFCEKPLATTQDDVREMSASCERAGVHLVEAFVFLFHAQTLQLRELLDGGAIGNLVATQAYFNFRLPRPSDNIRLNKDLGGGGLRDAGVYPVTFTRFVYGEEPIAVQAACRIDPDYGIDTRTSAVLTFSDDRYATIQTSIDAPGGPGAVLYGEEGSIVIPQPYHPRKGAHIQVHTPGGDRTYPFDDGRHPFTPAIEHFHDVLLDGTELAVPATNALGTVAIVDAIFESARTGNRIDL